MATAECTNDLGIRNSAARVLPKGTVVLSRTASVGFVTIMGRPMATSQDFANWVCGPELHPEFLMYVLMASRSYIRGLASGAVHKTVYMPDLESFQVCIPPHPDQVKIASQLEERLRVADRIRTEAEAQMEAIQRLPEVILREAFPSGEDS